MAIIIRPEDIYDISDRKILVNNNVEGVTIQEKIIKLGNTELKTEEVNTNSTFEDMSCNMAGNIFGIDAIRVEASYSSGSITLDKNLAFDKKNVQWVVTGAYTGEDKALCNVDVSTESYSVFRTSNTERFGSIAYFLDQPIKSFQQTGLWGENGKIVSFLYNNNINVTYQDESSITITETENNYVITYKILTKLAFVGAHFASVSSTSGTNGKGIIYVGEKIYFNITVNSATISDEQSAYTVGDITTGATISLDTNSLFQKDTKIGNDTIAEVDGQTIISDWKDGKESMTLDVMVGEYYDESDSLAISTQDNALQMTFNINDEVIPYITIPVEHTSGGETYYEFEDQAFGSSDSSFAKCYNVVGIELVNDGVVTQRLKICESSNTIKLNIFEDSKTHVSISRISSQHSDAQLGLLSKNNPIYKNDVIQVSFTGDYSFLTINGQFSISETEITVTEDIEIIARCKTLNEMSWSEIAQISEAGEAQDYFKVGDEKVFGDLSSIAGGLYDVKVAILGFNHDDLSDGSGKAGISFGMTNLYPDSFSSQIAFDWNGDARPQSYDGSDMKVALNNLFVSWSQTEGFDTYELAQHIKSVKKKYYTGGQAYNVQESNANYLWIYSYSEVTGNALVSGKNPDGIQYEYWRTIKNGTNEADRILYYVTGSTPVAANWITRSYLYLTTGSLYRYAYFNESGQVTIPQSPYYANGKLYFCFCI